MFESYPVWLFSIVKDFSQLIYFPQVANWSDLRNKILSASDARSISLFDALITAIGRSLCHFGTSSKEGILLVSGSMLFLHKHLANLHGMGI